MNHVVSLAVVALTLSGASGAAPDEVTVIAPGGMRCATDRMMPEFEQKTGNKVHVTIGSGGGTHQQVVRGEPFDVPIVQPPYQDVLASGHVVASSETPLATVPMVVVVKKGSPEARYLDISTGDAVKRMLLAAKALSYPDGAGGRGGAAGVSFDATQRTLEIYDQVQPKVKRVPGVSLMTLLTNGDIDVAVTFSSEVNDPGVEVVGPLPREISTPTALVGFVSTHAKAPDAAQALLTFLSSPDRAAAYKACGMQPGR
jgi:molybdate transport system substrate-binding protein